MRRSRWAVLGAGVWLFALLAIACSYLTEAAPVPYRPPATQAAAAAVDGQSLYLRDCAWCHGPEGVGTTRGPDLNGPLDGGAYTDFMLRTGRMPLSSPLANATRKTPAYDEQQIDAIVRYVETFGGTGPPVPTPDPQRGSLTEGRSLYQDNCAACHSTTGVGGALTSGQTVPALLSSTPREVAEALEIGPGCANRNPTCGPGAGAMPRFSLSDQETNSITRYVEYLQHPSDRGGEPLGRIGPVAEGAVGLLIGLLALILLVRWIGTREGEEG